MENDFDFNFDLENIENFKINPEVWLHTLLAIAGDKDKKAEMIQRVVEKTGYSEAEMELMIRTTIGILINQTRAN